MRLGGSSVMFFSFLYLSVRALLGLLVRSGRGPNVKDIELMVLRPERRPELDPACRVLDPCIDSRACRPQPSEPRSGRTARLPFSTSTARSPSTVRPSG